MSNLLEIIKRSTPRSIKRIVPARTKEQAKIHIKTIVRWCQGLNAESRALPDFIIAGSQKCGTTTLYTQLAQHPVVRPSLDKEIQYFSWNYYKGQDWYRSHFPVRRDDTPASGLQHGFVTGEASPYYMFYPHAFKRIAETLPEVRIIMLLRNPVDRAYSSYQHQCNKGRETYSFEEAIRHEDERLAGESDRIRQDDRYFSYKHVHFSYLSRGIYVDQILNCFEHFSRDRVLIIESGKFFSENPHVYGQVLDFLDLPPYNLKAYKNTNKRDYDPMLPETRYRLVEYFRPYNQQLYQLLGESYDWDR